VDLLLVDYAMPEMNGRIVIERARTIQPDIKTLLMTGYNEVPKDERISESGVLSKPFRIAKLSKRVSEILE
jgi:CheY-like chemotaxis protein